MNMDFSDQIRLRNTEHVVTTLEVVAVIHELLSAKGVFIELTRLDHRAHGAVEDRNALGQDISKLFFALGHWPAFLLFSFGITGNVARATKISTGRLPFRANFSPANEPVKS